MKKVLMGFLFSFSLILVACGGGDTATDDTGSSADEMDPESIYIGTCASCHGGNLEGRSAPQLSDIGANKSYEEILDVILNGQGGMPGGMLKEDHAKLVAQWLSEKE